VRYPMPGTWTTTGNLESNEEITYTNTSNTGIIKAIELKKYRDGRFQVSVKAQNEQTYQELLDTVTEVGFEPRFIDKIHERARVSSSNLPLIGHFLNTISAITPNHDEIRQEIANLLNIDLNQPFTMPSWIANGSLENNDSIIYTNTSNTGIIKTIELTKFRDGRYQVSVKARNGQTYQELRNTVTLAGFEPSFDDNILERTSVSSSNLPLIGHFLNTISTIIPNHDEIRQEFANLLNIDLNQPFTMPNWITTGDFDEIIHFRDPDIILRRQVQFDSTRSTSPIKNVQLLGYDGYFALSLKMRNTFAYVHLKNILISAGFELEDEFLTNTIRLKSADLLLIGHFLKKIHTFSPDFEEIKQTIADTLHINLDEPFTMPAPQPMPEEQIDIFTLLLTWLLDIPQPTITRDDATTLEEVLNHSIRETSGAVPKPIEIGKNQRLIDELEIKEVPERFLCNLTQTVMDDPVSDPVNPRVFCDRKHLVRCVDENGTNPFTNTPLTAEQLVPNNGLRKRIERFIRTAQEKKAAATAPKPITHIFDRNKMENVNEFANAYVDRNDGNVSATRKSSPL